MKLNEWCKRVGCSKQLAMKVLKENDGRVLLGADWFVTKSGMAMMDKLTPPRNTLNERANHWITEDNTVEPENENQVIVNLKQIRYNVMALVSIQDQNPELDIQSEMSSVFTQDLSDLILKIDNYINSKTAGE
jgi:hypothetical protein